MCSVLYFKEGIMEFGDILRQIRAERGLSQDELAALLGTTKQ
ncbi:MAG: helix-turn-helix domain-containing protein, partial [Christensenellales bacterium]